jgi:uncharacterized protein (DUF1778 family)
MFLNVRLRQAERALIQRAALKAGLWPSSWVRSIAVAAATDALRVPK